MLVDDDPWLMEELPEDEPAELLRTMPEIRQPLEPARAERDVGLRAILEHPEALSKAWWRQAARRSGATRGSQRPTVARGRRSPPRGGVPSTA